MFEEKYAAEAEETWETVKNYTRGDIIPWSVIELAMNRARTETGGWTIIKRLRERLLHDREICTLPEDTVGLRLLTDQEAASELPIMRQKKAYRQVSRCLREIRAVNRGNLSDHERLLLDFHRRSLREERLQIGRAERDAGKIGRTETLPIRR